MKAKNAVGRRTVQVSLLASGILMLTPSMAFAESSSGASLLLPKMGEFIPALIVFIILWIILAKLAWPAITGMLDKRAEKIKDDLASAEAARIESERLLAEHQKQMDEARAEAAQIIADAKRAGEAVEADITAKAQSEAEDMIAKANDAIKAQTQAAIAELQGSVANISVNVAGRLIGEDLTDEQHLKMVERYVEEAGSLNAN